MNDSTLSVLINKTKGTQKSVPFVLLLNMKNKILGKDYELSIAEVSAKTSKKINRETRGKDKPTNILSFSLSKKSGEILLHFPSINRDSKNFGMSKKDFYIYIVIHGMLHLKGMKHGSTMEYRERKFAREFGIKLS